MPDENGSEPQPQPNPQDWLLAQLRALLSNEVIPQLQRHQSEQIEARVSEALRNVRGATPDVQSLAAEVARVISPALSRDVQSVADTLAGRITRLEQASAPAGTTAAAPPATSDGAPAPVPAQGTVGGQAFQVAGLVESIADILGTKILPMLSQWQQMKRGTAYDLQWAAALRQQDPIMAATMASILNPDPLVNHLPEIQFNAAVGAFQQGMRLRSMANSAPASTPNPNGGTPPWPIPGQPQRNGSSGASVGGAAMSTKRSGGNRNARSAPQPAKRVGSLSELV